MPEEITPLSPPMEGKGSYNRYAKLPAGGAALALPLLEKAAQNVLLDRRDGPIVIADYGSSQGKNSLAPMDVAIHILRTRIGTSRPIMVFHVDQSKNDFNSLFECQQPTRTDTHKQTRKYFPVPLGDRSTRACFLRNRYISAGRLMRPYG